MDIELKYNHVTLCGIPKRNGIDSDGDKILSDDSNSYTLKPYDGFPDGLNRSNINNNE